MSAILPAGWLLALRTLAISVLLANAVRADPSTPATAIGSEPTSPSATTGVPAATNLVQAAPQEVVVNGLPPRREPNEISVSATQARRVTGTQGDPVKVIENLPGLARSAFGSDELVLWGAAPEDTRIYVDGVEIPQLFHGSGLRGTVNGDLLQSVTLTPGAYGPAYGRGIGGVVRLETRDLPDDGFHTNIDASTLDGSAFASASVGERVRVALAARYGWLDRTLNAVNAPDVSEYFAVPKYGDYQGKVQFALRGGESLDLVVLGSTDILTRTVPNADPARERELATKNAYHRAYLRYRRAFHDGSSVDVVPWLGGDLNRVDAHFGSNPAHLDQRSLRWGIRAEHRSAPWPAATLALGVNVAGADTTVAREGSLTIPAREGDVTVFGQPPGDDTNADTWRAALLNVAPYVKLDLDWGPLTLSPGLRFDGYLLEASRRTPRVGQTPSIGQSALDGEIEPRIGARLHLSERVALFAAVGMYSQPPAAQDLSAVFGTPTLGLASASHASLGESVDLTPTLSATTVAFYESMSHLAVRDPAPTPKLANALLEDGVGRSYGVQILVRQRPWRGFFGWVAYTISRSERRDSPEAGVRRFDFDEPHVLTAVGSKALGDWTFGLRFRYASGAPRTPVVGALYDEKDDAFQPIFGAHNAARLPDFWQLDARIDRSFRLGKGARFVAYVEALNVTNHANGEEYVYNFDYSRRGVVTGLPALGVVGVRLEL